MKFDPNIETEMKEAVALLWRWRRYHPAIAGNSLWCWAANKPAKDVDIFVKESWACDKNLRAHYGLPYDEAFNDSGSSGYGSIALDVKVFKSTTPSGKPVDIIMTKKEGSKIVSNFDYSHLMIAFDLKGFSSAVGVLFYTDGILHRVKSGGRDTETIRGKLQPALWGKPEAAEAMKRVAAKLDEELKAIKTADWVDVEEGPMSPSTHFVFDNGRWRYAAASVNNAQELRNLSHRWSEALRPNRRSQMVPPVEDTIATLADFNPLLDRYTDYMRRSLDNTIAPIATEPPVSFGPPTAEPTPGSYLLDAFESAMRQRGLGGTTDPPSVDDPAPNPDDRPWDPFLRHYRR
jgi:hypothetical protein